MTPVVALATRIEQAHPEGISFIKDMLTTILQQPF